MKRKLIHFTTILITLFMLFTSIDTFSQSTVKDNKNKPDKQVIEEDKTKATDDTKNKDVKADDKTRTGDKTKTDSKTKIDDKTATDDKTKTDDKAKADDKANADNKSKTDDKTKADDKAKQDKKVKEAADEAKKVEIIEKTLTFGIQKDRKAAINSIKDIKDPALQKKLITRMIDIIANDTDMEVRKIAITVAGDLKITEAGTAIIKALDDDSEDLKIAACYAITRLKITEAKPKLIEMIKKQDMTKDSNLTDAIIYALDEIGAPEIIQLAIDTIKDMKNSKMAREKFLLFIGKNGTKEQKDFLLGIYKDDEQEMLMRSYAIKSIAKLKITEASGDIKAVIQEINTYPFAKKKKYYDLYIHSVAALAEMGDKDAIPLLMDSLRSDNAAVRLKAIKLIKEFNDERTIDILKYKMDNDPSASVRKAARKALEEKGIIEKGKEEDTKGTDGKEEKDEKDETDDKNQ